MARIKQYEILETIGKGGMGTVYKAYHPLQRKYVALKEIHPELAGDADHRQRFEQEIRILSELPAHPHIVAFRDSFEVDDRLFLVMNYVEGQTLRSLIQRGPVESSQVLRILDQLLSALEVIHQAGIIHRDLKPENILLDQGGLPCLSDFGISENASVSSSKTSLGTAKYLAPELIEPERGETGGNPGQADLYALGIVGFELALGAARFQEVFRKVYREAKDNPTGAWLDWHCNPETVAPLLHELQPNIPIQLSRVIARLMSKNMKDRYSTAETARRDLKSVPSAPVNPHSDTQRIEKKSPVHVHEVATLTHQLPKRNKVEGRPSMKVKSKFNSLRLSQLKLLVRRFNTRTSWLTGSALAIWLTLTAVCLALFFFIKVPGFTVVVQGAPFGSEVLVDNEVHGIPAPDGTIRLYGMKAGNRVVKVRCEGFGDFRTSVTGRDGEVQTVVAQLRAENDGLPSEIEYSGPMILIPAGEFILGDDTHQPNEKPAHRVKLDDYYIDKLEVTNAQYKAFCDATKHAPPTDPWWGKNYFLGSPAAPVVGVTLEDARAYATWAGKRLPSEVEWEKAASWDPNSKTKRMWPWATLYTPGNAVLDAQLPQTVGIRPASASAYGVQDLAGNVAEWTDSPYLAYPNNPQPAGDYSEGLFVVRGGSFHGNAEDARTTRRMFHAPMFTKSDLEERSWLIGFRCAIAAKDPRLTAFFQQDKRVLN
ncbi:MAG: SUMF1/EgtB/PvdO family nonheme iron enzyme [Blastocatellia bacterium]|nr:SUMF1/EgtB/PvdO family nonheme iron enzyme [Blastocatellia bacterium]